MAISLIENVKLGFLDFLSRKLRSFITILGVILGTMSIIVILSIVQGLAEQSLAWIHEMGGMNKISLQRNWQYQNTNNLSQIFTLREFEFIRNNIPRVEAFNANQQMWTLISNPPNNVWVSAIGTLADYQIVEEWTVSDGRFLSDIDFTLANDVIVLGSTIAQELFGNRNPIGQLVTVGSRNRRRMTVIGVMERREMETSGMNFGAGQNPLEWMNRMALIPLSTAITKLGTANEISEITIRAFDEKQSRILTPILTDLLLGMRQGEAVFRVSSALENAERTNQTSRMFTIIFFFVSAISLFVGGVVIMNILLASIKERTREIGIRIAVGARQFDIMLQFLIQSVVITFVGGLFGALLGMSIAGTVGDYLKIPVKFDFYMIFIALLVSVGVGLFFGIYPAIKASKLDPVQALRVD